MNDAFIKDPQATLDYTWDWSQWLDDISDTISSAVVTVPDGLTPVGSPTITDSTVTQIVSGGQLGDKYTLVCQITTSSGLIDERSIRIVIRNR